MKTLLAAAAFALLITPAQAGTWGCFKKAIMLQPVVGEECGDRNAREARGFERRSVDRPQEPHEPKEKPKKEKKPNAGPGNGSEGNPDKDPGKSEGKNRGGD